ncbi:MAG: HIT domain-containing protein [Opitutales bacterium]
MENLHSYWRMPYIEAPKKGEGKENPFIEIPKAKDPKSVHLVYKGEYAYIVMNKFPYNCGHLLVVPLRQVAQMSELTAQERVEYFDLIIKAQDILTKAIKPDAFNVGFNLGAKAGAGIPSHLHCHIVPRWDGDTNFMPVISNTKVLPEAMDTLWEKLIASI